MHEREAKWDKYSFSQRRLEKVFLCFLYCMEKNSIILICTYIHVNVFCYIYIYFFNYR